MKISERTIELWEAERERILREHRRRARLTIAQQIQRARPEAEKLLRLSVQDAANSGSDFVDTLVDLALKDYRRRFPECSARDHDYTNRLRPHTTVCALKSLAGQMEPGAPGIYKLPEAV